MIKFEASLPPIQSAISLDGQGDGARVKLDIPRSDIQAAIKLQEIASKGETFHIIVVTQEDEIDNENEVSE